MTILGLIIYIGACGYGTYAIITGRPAFQKDYWLVVWAMVVSMILIFT